MTFRAMGCCALVALAACGEDESFDPEACKERGGETCFQLPTAPLQTRDGAPSKLGCGAVVPKPAPTPVTFSGSVLSFGSSKPIPAADIKLYSETTFATPIATTMSGDDATYSIQVPAGTGDVLHGRFSAAGYLDIYIHNTRPDLSNGDIPDFTLRLVTADNIEGAGLIVKELWDPAVMVVAGNVYDCDRLIVQHAAVAMSSVSGQRKFVDGASVYYGAPGAAPIALPPDERADTNDNGAFAVFRVPAGTFYLQAWGFVDAAAQAKGEAGLSLIGESPLHGVTNAVANVAIWSR